MKATIIAKFRNKLLVTALIAQVISLLVLTGVITPSESEHVNAIIVGVLEILTTVGVFSNTSTVSGIAETTTIDTPVEGK